MNLNKVFSLFIVVLLLQISGCAKKTTIVLLPDPDGKVGHITVTSEGGQIDLTQPNEATVIAGRESSPSAPRILSEKQIQKEYSQLLEILPGQPEHFLLYFKNDSTELTPSSRESLPQIFQSIASKRSEYISIFGHADSAGDPRYNLDLSRKRANAVDRLLVAGGVSPKFISTTSHGEENPLIKTADNVNEPRNRRVEVVVR